MNTSLQEQAYIQIKEKIINLDYPPNSIISESALLLDLDMSRTPVREGLIRLENERFVKILPKRGIQILPLTLADVKTIYDTRLLIEPFCLRNYNRYISLDKINEVYHESSTVDFSDTMTFYKLDKKIHHLIAMSGPNSYLNTTLQNVYDQHNRICGLAKKNVSERYQKAIDEHLVILAALMTELKMQPSFLFNIFKLQK